MFLSVNEICLAAVGYDGTSPVEWCRAHSCDPGHEVT